MWGQKYIIITSYWIYAPGFYPVDTLGKKLGKLQLWCEGNEKTKRVIPFVAQSLQANITSVHIVQSCK
jgi:hypothetical protein